MKDSLVHVTFRLFRIGLSAKGGVDGGDGIQKLLGFRKSIAVDLEESQKGRERELGLLCPRVDVIAHQSGGGEGVHNGHISSGARGGGGAGKPKRD